MKCLSRCLAFLLFCGNVFAQNTAKPWAYWWWLGSAVNRADIQENLRQYAGAGFGGLHIIPIYGVQGEESKFLPYLSPEWLEMLDYTVQEAQKLGLGIDMTLGTGWPFGGKHVAEADAAKAFDVRQVGSKYELVVSFTKQQVKRAAPGGEGNVLDHFNANAVQRYFSPFAQVFQQKNYGVRAFYNDSYEVYGANWTTDFLIQFKKLRGYDLAEHLDVFKKKIAETEREKRIWADYHETLSDLVFNEFTQPFVDFSHQFNKLVRNEAHGSPANILDLYALSDIPESEFFGSKPYPIPYYRQDPDYEENRFGKPEELVLKLASSAAHVAGKRLVSSETATWLGNHFKVSLAQIKPIIDESFVGGINHIFYHGIPYSPPNEPFPGWLFYASTNFNPQSHFWNELPLLNKYIENCQNLLQNAQPDNDILVYFPIYDMWHAAGTKSKTHAIDVHNLSNGGIFNESFRNLLSSLKNEGYSFDFISDKQLQKCGFSKNVITEGKSQYQTILVPPLEYVPLTTLQALIELQKAGAKVVFSEKLPRTVNGFQDYERREKQFKTLIANFKASPDILQELRKQEIRQENLAGLRFIRKKNAGGHLYFITNLSGANFSNEIRLAVPETTYKLYNPLSGEVSFSKSIQLEAGESIIVQTSFDNVAESEKLINSKTKEQILTGNWQVTFQEGEPFLPKSYRTETLNSWTNAPDTAAQYFSGVAKYQTSFKTDAIGKKGILYLGDVRESASVSLNGVSLGTTWSLPFKVVIPANLLRAENFLEISVRNASANRIRYLDKQGVKWKKFYDINFVDIQYKPFDASKWKPLESGLLSEPILRWEE